MKPLVPERSFPPNSEPTAPCNECGTVIPVANLRQVHPTSRKLYCWPCAEKHRRKLPTGTAFPDPHTPLMPI